MERTLVLLKPDAVQRGLVGQIIARLEGRGLKIAAMKLMQMDQALAHRHYQDHVGKSFFPGLIGFITSGPLVAMVLEGKEAVAIVRATMGDTNAAKAAPGTVRGDFAVDMGMNLIHGSDSRESAQREIGLFFKESEVLAYQRDADRWIAE
jgi:nucleoside-diphosphate kinase